MNSFVQRQHSVTEETPLYEEMPAIVTKPLRLKIWEYGLCVTGERGERWNDRYNFLSLSLSFPLAYLDLPLPAPHVTPLPG